MNTNIIETSGLGKRYRSTWALRECTLEIPAGHVVALVGPNGAGKTTLLNLAVGLATPTAGGVTVLGGHPAGSPAALDGIAFVAQDTPLYKNLSTADMLHLTANLNRSFDQPYARARLAELGIPLRRKAGKLSGGRSSACRSWPVSWRRAPSGTPGRRASAGGAGRSASWRRSRSR
jgi:ABC-2 type transport system ATP-binding protein